jgi:hypothetical protein
MSVADLLYVSVVMFALVIVFSVVYSLQSTLFPALSAQIGSGDPVVTGVITSVQSVFPVFDIIATIVFFGAMIGILALAYLLPTTPVTVAINLVAMMVVFLVTPVFTNSFMETAAALPSIDVSTVLPYTYFLMQNYPLFVMVFGFALFVVLVARFRTERGTEI